MLDFYGASKVGSYFYSSDNFSEIGTNFTAISWHSFAVYKNNAISVPKVHFKEGSRRVCVDSRGYVHKREIIAYPVISVIIKNPAILNDIGPRQSVDINSVIPFETKEPVCIDLFIIPKGIDLNEFLTQHDSSVELCISTNSIFMPATGHAFEYIKHNGAQFPEIKSINLNGWTCVFRISDPPRFTCATVFPDVSIISYDLKTVAASILDRTIAYPTDDPNVLKKTTFRERLRNIQKQESPLYNNGLHD